MNSRWSGGSGSRDKKSILTSPVQYIFTSLTAAMVGSSVTVDSELRGLAIKMQILQRNSKLPAKWPTCETPTIYIVSITRRSAICACDMGWKQELSQFKPNFLPSHTERCVSSTHCTIHYMVYSIYIYRPVHSLFV